MINSENAASAVTTASRAAGKLISAVEMNGDNAGSVVTATREVEELTAEPSGAAVVHAVSNLFVRVSYFCEENPIFCPGSLWTYTMTK